MSSTIIIKNSATSGSVPSSLVQGEFAINVLDGKLYYGSGSGNVVKEFNTSSYSFFAVSSSFSSTASFVNPLRQTVLLTGSLLISGSEVITGSLAISGSGSLLSVQGDEVTISGDLIEVTGSLRVTGSATVVGSLNASSITGSLLGTASWASNAITSSNALTASFVNPLNQNVLLTGSLLATGSITLTGSANISANLNFPFVTVAGGISGFGLNYFTVTARETNTGIAASFGPNGNPGGNGYVFQFAANTTVGGNGLLLLGVNGTNKHIITTSKDAAGGSAWPLVFRVATANWSTAPDMMTLTTTQNVLIGTSTDAGYRLNVSGSGNFTDNLTVTGSFTVVTGSKTEFQVLNTGVKIGDLITDIHTVTGSLNISGSISASSANFGTITATSGSITYLTTIFETSSIIYSSGSNQFGDASDDVQTLWGTVDIKTGPVLVTGSMSISGSLNAPSITGSLLGTASYADYATSASYALSSSFATNSQNAQDILIYVKNSSGAQIDKGKVVRISGAVGDNPLISTASYTDDANSANTLGITNENIANDSFGYVITEGVLKGIDTSGYTAGQLLYLGATGSITGSAPIAPLHNVRLGEVLRVQLNNGSMYVRIDNGYELGELHDVVDTTTTSSYGDLLVKSGSVWVNSRQLTGSYGLTGSFAGGSFSGSFSGSFQGNGSGLTNIPASGITGLNLSQIATGSVSASVSPGTSSFQVTSGSTNFLFVSSSGNIGIGTTTPTSAKLQVSGSTSALGLQGSGSGVFTVDGTSGRLFSVDDSLSGSLFSVNTAAGLPLIEAFSDNTVRIGQFGQRALFVSQSKVGIGKESALNGILDVSGSVTVTGSFNATGSFISTFLDSDYSALGTGYSFEIKRPTSDRGLRIGTNQTFASVVLLQGAAGANASDLIINPYGGKVGVGINSFNNFTAGGSFIISSNQPNSSNHNWVIFDNQAAGYGDWNFYKASSNDFAIGYGFNGVSHTLHTYYRYGGNLGVGTSSPDYKLDVNGTGNFRGDTIVTGSFTVTTGSLVEFQVTNTGVKVGNASTDVNTVTGSLQVAGQTRISGSFNTAVSGTILTVVGSGSTQPIFTVQGSQGELFSVTDSLTGSLFSVNDISGLPILEVFSDSTTNIGNYLAPAVYTTNKITQTNSGSFVVYSLPTASYDGAFYDYTVRSGSNARAGQIMAIWSGSSVNFTETTTTSFGSTSAINFTVIVSGSNMVLTGSSATGSWTIKTIIRSI